MSPSTVVMFVAVFAFCCLLSTVTSRRHVEKMQIIVETEEDDVKSENWVDTASAYRDLFHRMGTNLKLAPQNTLPQLGAFKWNNCGSSSDLVVINGLTVTPDPLRLPGNVGLKFDINIQETFDAPLKVVLEVKKYEGFFWLHIPCIEGKGSCTFDDFCQQLASLTCPKEFTENKIPCKCPFTKGQYSLPSSTFSIPVSVPSGQYYIKAVASYDSKAVNCMEVWFNVS